MTVNRRTGSLIPVAAQLVGTVRDYGPEDVQAVLAQADGRHAELALVLAAMVDPDASPAELLAWQKAGPVQSRDAKPMQRTGVGGRPKAPREHGTDRGYFQHRNRKDWPACEPCRIAHNEATYRPVKGRGETA